MNFNKKLLLLGGVLPVCAMSCTSEAKTESKPNVVLILVDDLGKEWIEQYGAQNISTPNINALAEQSIQFNRAYSMPQSTPSRVAILTGQYPHNNGWVNHYDVPRWGHGAHYDFANNPCFPRQVRENGYKTCAAGKWQLNDFRLQPEAMVEAGFDEYCMWTGGEGGNAEISESRYWDPYIHTKEGSRQYKGQFGPDVYSDFVCDFIDKNSNEPMFIYYPMALTHLPYTTTPHALDAKTNREKFDAMIEYMDFLVGKVVAQLEESGVADNTYIMFTTDNGTAGSIVGMRNDHYIRGGKTLLSENGVNCPFLVYSPKSKSHRETNAIIDFTDISATILELTGSTPDSKYKGDGVSFVSVIEGAETSNKGYALTSGGHPARIGKSDDRVKSQYDFRDRAIVGETYKVFLTSEREIERVYDIANDPYEQNNLVGEESVMAQVEKELGGVISGLPEKDASPKYDVLPHNKEFDEPFDASRSTRSNFAPLSDKRSYETYYNGGKKKSK